MRTLKIRLEFKRINKIKLINYINVTLTQTKGWARPSSPGQPTKRFRDIVILYNYTYGSYLTSICYIELVTKKIILLLLPINEEV